MNKTAVIDGCIILGIAVLLFFNPYMTDTYIHDVLWISGHPIGDTTVQHTQAVVNDYPGNVTAITNYNPNCKWVPFGQLVTVPNNVWASNSTTDILVVWNDLFFVDCLGGVSYIGNSTELWYRPANSTMGYTQQ